MFKNINLAILVLIFLSLNTFSAEEDYDNQEDYIEIDFDHGATCNYTGVLEGSGKKKILSFSSDRQATKVVNRILKHANLSKYFDIRAADVPNAAAVVEQNPSKPNQLVRRILYNPEFMTRIKKETGTQWAAVSIMAHEIAHHLNAHTLDLGEGSRPKSEIEADQWSGYILGLMGASLEEAQAAMKKLANNQSSQTHPAKRDRLVAIAHGWRNAKGLVSDDNDDDISKLRSECRDDGGKWNKRTEECDDNDDDISKLRSECRDDGGKWNKRTEECDEEKIFHRNDQNRGRQQHPQQRPAQYCCNPYTGAPVCPMGVAMPQGQSCVCSGHQGQGITCG